jgi:hypothetical protein
MRSIENGVLVKICTFQKAKQKLSNSKLATITMSFMTICVETSGLN